MGFWANGRYRLFSDAERREFGQRKAAERSKEWHKVWVSKMRLKAHWNWTDGAITKFLGKPVTAGQGKNGKIIAYRLTDVQEAEKLPQFKKWMDARVDKQAQKDDPEIIFGGLNINSYAMKSASVYLN